MQHLLINNLKNMKKITSSYIVGFTDGEGCFTLHIYKKPKTNQGFCFTPSFSISQNSHSIDVLFVKYVIDYSIRIIYNP